MKPASAMFLAGVLAFTGTFAAAATPEAQWITQQGRETLGTCSKEGIDTCLDDLGQGTNILRECGLTLCSDLSQPGNLDADQVRQALEKARVLLALGISSSSPISGQAAAVNDQILEVERQVGAGTVPDARVWDSKALVVGTGNNPELESLAAIRKNCVPVTGWAKGCDDEMTAFVAIRYTRALVQRALQKGKWDEVVAASACLDRLKGEYNAYFDAARFQWPWELGINSVLYARQRAREKPVCLGFSGVPSSQILFLHPSVGISYDSGAGQKTSAVILMEVVGLRRWQWVDGMASGMKGASVVAVYDSQQGSRPVSWGLLFHVKDNISIGAVRSTSGSTARTSFVMSYDFGKLFEKDRQAACADVLGPTACQLIKPGSQ